MATYVVTTQYDVVADDDVLSLREALALANADGGADTISFSSALAGKTIKLSGQELAITTDVTIIGDVNGDYRADITISGDFSSRIFNITGADSDVILKSLTLTQGYSSYAGGAVYVNDISSLTIIDSTISSSQSRQEGGGLYVRQTDLHMGNTTLYGNLSLGGGGGASIDLGDAELHNVSVLDNLSFVAGGGLFVGADGRADIYNSTVNGNYAGYMTAEAGGGIATTGTLNVTNSIVAGNLSNWEGTYEISGGTANDVKGTVTTGAFSTFGTTPTFGMNLNSMVQAVSFTSELTYIGRVATRELSGSTYYNTANPDFLPSDIMDLDHDGDTSEKLSVDARGFHRSYEGGVDAGAVEHFSRAPTDLYTAFDGLPLFDSSDNAITADSLFDGDNETIVMVLPTAREGGQLSVLARAQIAQANNLITAAQTAGHPLDVRIVTLDGTTSLEGLSPYVSVLHLDPTLPDSVQAMSILMASLPSGAPEYYAYHRAPAATDVDQLPSFAATARMGGKFDLITRVAELEEALAGTGIPVDIATSEIRQPTATTERGQFDEVGETMPNFTFRDHNGEALKLRDVGTTSNDLILVSFCTEWCAPCTLYSRQLPSLQPILGSDFAYLEVMLEDENGNMATDATAQAWVSRWGTAAPVVTVGDNAGALMDLARGANINEFPLYFVVERTSGKIVDTWSGYSEQSMVSEASDTLDAYYSKLVRKTYSGSSRDNTYTGGKGFDKISGGGGNDKLKGLNGNDSITGGTGKDSLYGGTGRDTLKGGDGSDRLYGEAGNDTLYGDASSDTLDGGYGNDKLYGGSGNDKIYGRDGDDTVTGGSGADTLDGGNGLDTLSYAGSKAVTVNLSTNKASGGDAKGDVISNFENVIGSSGNDRITGSAGNNIIVGGKGADTLDGGAGEDTLSYAGSTAVSVNLKTNKVSGGDAKGDVISNFEHVMGSSGNDTITGNDRNNWLDGGAGNDRISGGSAGTFEVDILFGGSGNDTLQGGMGHHHFHGDSGRDTVTYESATGGIFASLLEGIGFFYEAEGDRFFGVENLVGSRFGDTLTGSNGANEIRGNGGNDSIHGMGGSDLVDYSYATTQLSITLVNGEATVHVSATDIDELVSIENLRGGSAGDQFVGDDFANKLFGNGGNDTLVGGAGNDTLSGGADKDRLTGGAGNDRFVFDTKITSSSVDTITDFVRGEDKIELSKSMMGGLGKAGALASSAFYAASGAKKAHDSTDRIIYDKASGRLYYDKDGKGGSDAIHFATLSDKPLISASDFLIV